MKIFKLFDHETLKSEAYNIKLDEQKFQNYTNLTC